MRILSFSRYHTKQLIIRAFLRASLINTSWCSALFTFIVVHLPCCYVLECPWNLLFPRSILLIHVIIVWVFFFFCNQPSFDLALLFHHLFSIYLPNCTPLAIIFFPLSCVRNIKHNPQGVSAKKCKYTCLTWNKCSLLYCHPCAVFISLSALMESLDFGRSWGKFLQCLESIKR